MKSVIIASIGAVSVIANIADDTVLLQVRTRKSVASDPSMGGVMPPLDGDYSFLPANGTVSGDHSFLPANGTVPHAPDGGCPDCHSDDTHLPAGDEDWFEEHADDENFMEEAFGYCADNQAHPTCIFFMEEVLPLAPDTVEMAGAIAYACEMQGGEDCDHEAEAVAAAIATHMHEDELKYEEEHPLQEEYPAADEYHFSPCERWNIGEVWDHNDWYATEPMMWEALFVQSADACEMETSVCGSAPYCDWYDDVDPEDPYCMGPKIFESEDEYWACADPIWEKAHGNQGPCSNGHKFDFHVHPSGLTAVVEVAEGIDALCEIEYHCSDGFENWGHETDMCVCDNFYHSDADFSESCNAWWVEEMCWDLHEAGPDYGNDNHDHQYDEPNTDSTDLGFYKQQLKRVGKMAKKSLPFAKKLLSRSGLKHKMHKKAFMRMLELN